MTTYSTRPPRVEVVIRDACEHFGVEREAIMEGSQRRLAVAARQEICKALRMMEFTLAQIGEYLNIHHSTVHAAVYGKPAPARKVYDGSQPDLSGEWAI